jgi:acetoin utilization deacetylase AcuC-like enzyme
VTVKTVFSDRQLLQDGSSELIDGKLVKAFESKRRAEIVLARVHERGIGPVVVPTDHTLEPVARVHTRPFIEFLRTAWDEWVVRHGEYDALPLVWPTRTMRHDRVPDTIDGKLSYFALDAGTPIMSGTWSAITAAADVALTGADLVLAGEPHAFALCRPPGHHAASDVYGGYCFFNNAAVAAQYLRDRGAGTVAILDVDYHHGNGTQAIFYDRPDVVFASIHGHPSQEYPFFLGYDDERGAGTGSGANANFPLRHGSGWDVYEPTLASAIDFLGGHRPDALIVSLGVDTYRADPISKFLLDHEHFTRIGEMVAGFGLPTLVVFEGGYAVDEIGVNAVNVLEGLAG